MRVERHAHRHGHGSRIAASVDTVPDPWTNETLSRVFLFGNRSRQLDALFSRQRQALAERIATIGVVRARQLFAALRTAGLESSPLGLDFTLLQARRYPTSPADILLDADVLKALQLTVFPVDVLIERSAAAAHAMWSRDQPARRVAVPSNRTNLGRSGTGLLRHLHGEGFALVRDWSEWGLDLLALSGQVERAMQPATANAQREDQRRARPAGGIIRKRQKISKAELKANMTRCCIQSRVHLPALDPLLNNPRLADVLRNYIGGPVRYDGSVILNLTDSVSLQNYASAMWHHDRCGRRIKLFIFLHDVYSDGRPTVVAARSHNLLYYSYGNPWQLISRYSEEWVQSQYQVVPMTGAAGGGFLFDTNSLHKGEVLGRRGRVTVILEFHGHGKVHQMKQHNNPCPSGGKHKEHGTPGFQEYPVESYGPRIAYEYAASSIDWPTMDLSGYFS